MSPHECPCPAFLALTKQLESARARVDALEAAIRVMPQQIIDDFADELSRATMELENKMGGAHPPGLMRYVGTATKEKP